ncbi:MAG: hypothetical protein ABJB73_10090 [Candidatus Nitrosocosmicus sp.]
MNKLDVKINDNKSKKFKTDYAITAEGSIGIKVPNRGQSIRDK